MFLIKKFYDTAIAETGGGESNTQTIAPPVNDIAALMAKSGVKNSSPELIAPPIQLQRTEEPKQTIPTEKKEEPKAAEKEKTVETTTPSIEAKANSETLKPEVEQVKSDEPKISEVSKEPVKSWQEVLKSQQPDTVLKELGFDDKTVKFIQKLKSIDPAMVNFLDKWESKEDVKGYLKEWTTDYSKMSAEDVMRHQLRAEYPKASEKQLDALYKKEIVEAYNLDSEDTAQVAEGTLLLDAKADKFRDKLIELQQSKLLPNPPAAKVAEPDNSEQQQREIEEAYKSTVNKDPYAEKVFEKKQITIGKGEDKFTYKIDPESIQSVLYDTDKWTETQFDKVKQTDGSFKYVPKVENQILTAAFAINPQKFLDEYAQHYLSIGGKKAIEPIDNAKINGQVNMSQSKSHPKSVAEAMAKEGKANYGSQAS